MKSSLSVLIALFCALHLDMSEATQRAMVVGINQYRHASPVLRPGALVNLRGAVNDARLLAQSLRDLDVDLPDQRILLNEHATRTAFLRAWHHMLAQAQPGDTLILTYAGHGGQEREQHSPWDEHDRADETLQFHEFDPQAQQTLDGRISDDELHGLFQDADEYRIVFVADTCHSGGLARQAPTGRSRSGVQLIVDKPRPASPIRTQGDEGDHLAHVTVISATDNDALLVQETVFQK